MLWLRPVHTPFYIPVHVPYRAIPYHTIPVLARVIPLRCRTGTVQYRTDLEHARYMYMYRTCIGTCTCTCTIRSVRRYKHGWYKYRTKYGMVRYSWRYRTRGVPCLGISKHYPCIPMNYFWNICNS
jgi:hypothetical protein